jgi:GalNAc-alpha-(1->4)-GalNAc-alpha-(1->3)-diNAcBac-PP-undecaprenol alpha-1,4-N-acetyl-D-galactosaminyltransferase
LKIFVIINGLDSGGAEKSTIKLCEGLIEDGHSVELITMTSSSDFYLIPPVLPRVILDKSFNSQKRIFPSGLGFNRIIFWLNQIRRTLIFRDYIKKENPDCVIAMSASVSVFTFFSTRFLNLGIVGSERIHPDSRIWSHGFLTDLFRPYIYRHGMILSVQSKSVSEWCWENWNTKSVVTPNHLIQFPTSGPRINSSSATNGITEVLAVSRDHPQKNLDFLLQSWKYVEESMDKSRLSIIGPIDVNRLKELAVELNLENARILPRTDQLDAHYKEATLFLSTSHFEGFPNVVLEAISFGIPVVTTPSCDVVQDFANAGACFVEHSKNPREFAQTIIKILSNQEMLSQMSQNALELSKKYSWECVRTNWYHAIDLAQKRYL